MRGSGGHSTPLLGKGLFWVCFRLAGPALKLLGVSACSCVQQPRFVLRGLHLPLPGAWVWRSPRPLVLLSAEPPSPTPPGRFFSGRLRGAWGDQPCPGMCDRDRERGVGPGTARKCPCVTWARGELRPIRGGGASSTVGRALAVAADAPVRRPYSTLSWGPGT